ncbi:high affinity copper uptake protein 1 [Biomphalaria glabrata]|nr:high affinity copper uptake protein 1 [Biomphalaria glabrata]
MSHDHMAMATTTMGPHNHPMNTTMNHNQHNMPGMDPSGMDHSGMDHSSMDHSMHGMNMNMSMDMKMYFHTGIMEYVLFESCMTSTAGGMVGACFIIFFVAVLYEGLKYLREVLLQRTMTPASYAEARLPAGSSTEQMVMHVGPSVMNRMLSTGHFLQTFLHIVQVFISYCLMLVFMTYNVWLCLAVILGAGLGYFLFGWKRAVVVDSNEHCH